VVEKSEEQLGNTGYDSDAISASNLLSPLDGNPIASKGSRLVGFRRLHGVEEPRPSRDDIEATERRVYQLL
jgi:hypothetical protein